MAACLEAAVNRAAWPRSASRARLIERLRERLGGDATSWLVQFGEAVGAVASLQPLPWDAAIYGLRMARLETAFANGDPARQRAAGAALLPAVLQACRRARIQHVAARARAGDTGWAQALETARFSYVDTTITLAWMSGPVAGAAPPRIRQAVDADLPALQRIAADAMVHGRALHDPWLPAKRGRQMYRAWVTNACRGRSDAVFVWAADGPPAGLVCCNLERGADAPVGYVDFLAVAPESQGQGIGRALLRAAMAWLAPRARLVEIRTQLANTVSLILYQQAGFRVCGPGIALPSGHTFHAWLGRAQERKR